MAFNLKGFASGLADAGTSYLEDKQDRRKDATTAKRSLMFNATEKIYNDALEVKKSNDVIKNKDKQYISKIKSIDSTISTDNMNKLLSLSAEDRLKAEEEYNYRAGQTPDQITFGDFMSAVEESTDLDDPSKIDANMEASMMPAPKPVSAYYDKTGLISDESVNNLYTEITSTLQEVHGFSVAKAKEITKQGIYSVQHPPIKINWSKDIALSKDAMDTLARARIYDEAQIANAGLSILNSQVDLTNQSLDSMRKAFAVGYQAEQFDEDKNSLGKQVVPAAMAPNMPNFEADFRNSPEYKEYALTSISSYIVGIETDPKANTKNAMTYINGTFPGMYGGKIETRKLTEAAFSKIEPNKIYYVDAPSPAGTDEDGFIMTGAQLKATRVDSSAEAVITNDNDDVTTGEVSVAVNTLQDELAFAIEMNAAPDIIERIEKEIEEAMLSSESDVTTANFKAKQKKDASTSAKTFEPDAVRIEVWDKNLDLAIQMGDMEKVQLVVDFVEARPDTSYKSNMSPKNRLSRRAKVALADMMREQNPTLQDTLDSISKVLPGSLLTRAKRIDSEVARDFLKKLDSYPLPENTDDLAELNKVKKELYRNI